MLERPAIRSYAGSRWRYLQILVNGVVLGALYTCLAVGFSLVWGVLNVINMLHGSLIILGGYLTFFAWHSFGIHPLAGVTRCRARAFRCSAT